MLEGYGAGSNSDGPRLNCGRVDGAQFLGYGSAGVKIQ